MRAAFGLRAHSGWAVLVAAAGSVDDPHVLERRRIVIADPEMSGSRQPYHTAAELPLAEAGELVRRAVESSRALALEAISAQLRELRSRGHPVEAYAVLCRSGKPLPELGKVLESHALIHTAEGQMFREALLWAGRECGLNVTAVPEKELGTEALRRIGSLGKAIGPPWTQDQKFATLAALVSLQAGVRSKPA